MVVFTICRGHIILGAFKPTYLTVVKSTYHKEAFAVSNSFLTDCVVHWLVVKWFGQISTGSISVAHIHTPITGYCKSFFVSKWRLLAIDGEGTNPQILHLKKVHYYGIIVAKSWMQINEMKHDRLFADQPASVTAETGTLQPLPPSPTYVVR